LFWALTPLSPLPKNKDGIQFILFIKGNEEESFINLLDTNMENGFNIVGKNISTERKEIFAKKYEDIEKEAMTPYTNELKKSEKATEIIGFVNACLKKEFEKMNLQYKEIPIQKIHVFSKEGFEKTFYDKKEAPNGFYSATFKEANIKASDDVAIAGVLKSIIHEMVHLASHNAYFANPDNEELKENYRTGYFNNQYQSENYHFHFMGLNEGIIDLVVSEIVQDNLDTILKMLAIEKEDWKDVNWYYDESGLINRIAEKIAQQKDESFDDVYMKFKRGLFSGEMMYLRDVERVYGKDSLRILSYLNSSVEKDDSKGIYFKEKIYEFFETDNEERRKELHDEIMRERQS